MHFLACKPSLIYAAFIARHYMYTVSSNFNIFDILYLQEFLDAFATAVSSEFGCLLIMGKVAVATERW